MADEEAGSHYHPEAIECQAVPCERGWRLSGHKRVVIGGELAHTILVTARMSDGEGVSLFLLDPAAEGVSRTGYPCIDGPRACDLALADVYVEADSLLGSAGKAAPALAYQRGRAVAARASQLIAEQSIQLHGGIGMTWEYSLAHLAKRLVMLTHQFGDDDFHLGQYSALLETPRLASQQVA